MNLTKPDRIFSKEKIHKPRHPPAINSCDPPRRTRRILVGADEPAVTDLPAYNLRKAHYDVSIAADGRAAPRLAEDFFMIEPRYLTALHKIHAGLMECHFPWAVTGSLGMALQGMEIEIHDIDIQTDQRGAYEIEKRFSEFVIKPVRFSASAGIRSHFGAMEMDGIKIEIMGDIQKLLEDQTWEQPVKVEQHRCWADLDGMHIPVLSLEYEYQAYLKLGRVERAEKLKKWLEENHRGKDGIRPANP